MTETANPLDALNASLAAARNAAASAVPATNPTGGAVAVVSPLQAPGRPVSMREMVAEGGMSVKAYLKVTPAGFNVGKDSSTYFDEIEVEFRLNEARPFYGVRYGNPPTYKRSVDRLVETRSKRPWADVVAEAQRLDARCTGDYRGLDLPLTSVGELLSKDKKTVLAAPGDKLGWTSSVTNWNDWAEFIAPYFSMMDNGLLAEDALVRGKIRHEQGTKEGVQPWGILRFGDFTIADNGQAQAA